MGPLTVGILLYTTFSVPQAVYNLGPLLIGMAAGNSNYHSDYGNAELISGRTSKYCDTSNDGSLKFNHAVLSDEMKYTNSLSRILAVCVSAVF